MDKKYTVGKVMRLWEKSDEAAKFTDCNFRKYLRTALKRYVAPEIDKAAHNLSPKKFTQYCENWDIATLKDALKLFDRSFDAAVAAEEVSKATKGNYRSALGRFMSWVEVQTWWNEIFIEDAMPKIAPPRRSSVSSSATDTLNSESRQTTYSLNEDELSEFLKNQLENYKIFRLTGEVANPQNKEDRKKAREERKQRRCLHQKSKIQEKTFQTEKRLILGFLGWSVKEEEINISELRLELLTDLELLEDFNTWSVQIRGNNHSTGIALITTGIAIAKWLNYYKSQRRNWGDIAIIGQLQDLRAEFGEEYKKEKNQNQVTKWSKKEISHAKSQILVQELQKDCAFRNSEGQKRHPSAIARAWLVYLMVKILVYCPVRQGEIRQLKLGETLFRAKDSQDVVYYYVAVIGKDFSSTGRLRRYKLPSIITKDLEQWLNIWIPKIKQALESDEEWAKFWGFSLEHVKRAKERLELALQGNFEKLPKKGPRTEKYIDNLKLTITRQENRIAERVIAKDNFEKYDLVFFSFGYNHASDCGKPLQDSVFWDYVTTAVKRVTRSRLDIFEIIKETNPHAFRHIGEKHVRNVRPESKGTFGRLIGHSEKMGDEYAEQITSEYELTQEIVDDWWEES